VPAGVRDRADRVRLRRNVRGGLIARQSRRYRHDRHRHDRQGELASSRTASGAGTAPDQGGAAPCANADLKIAWGPCNEGVYQYEAVIFTDISGGTCMLRGYPGAAITVGGTVINAVRELNGMRGDKAPLASPPLVTLTPGASASASFLWKLHDGRGCYRPGTGSISVTAPNTTKLSS
jgi:Domain of unknown function (DUF4232)